VILIADSGSTKCEWCFIQNGKKKTIVTTGISPYFLSAEQILSLLQKELLPKLKNLQPETIHYYGTGLSDPENAKLLKRILKTIFPKAKINLASDLIAAARALCGSNKGIVCILGTGSNSCYYDGKKIVKNSPGLGYVLGDEGSGAYLGKKVIQYYLYKTFDEDLEMRFNEKYRLKKEDILDNVYKKPYPNRYLANFTHFLSENRGHYMIENILEDGINDFFFTHLNKYSQSWVTPINFTGSVAFTFKDVIKEICNSYQLEVGKIVKAPMSELVKYHLKQGF
jgi:glucosamine kinase